MIQLINEKVGLLLEDIDENRIEETIHELEQGFILSQETMGELTPVQQANILATTYKIRRIMLEVLKESKTSHA